MKARGLSRILLASLLVAALAVAGCSSGGSASSGGGASGDKEPIKVGAILSLTGPYAALGAAEKKALDLEVQRLNDAGGVAGHTIEVVVEDDATDEAKAVAAAAKLIDQDQVVAILGATGTGQSMAIRGDIDRAGIPQISMAGGTAITDTFDKLVFQTPWSNKIVVPFVLNRMKALGLTKVGLITDSGGYQIFSLGPFVLRAETAAIAAVSIVQHQIHLLDAENADLR